MVDSLVYPDCFPRLLFGGGWRKESSYLTVLQSIQIMDSDDSLIKNYSNNGRVTGARGPVILFLPSWETQTKVCVMIDNGPINARTKPKLLLLKSLIL